MSNATSPPPAATGLPGTQRFIDLKRPRRLWIMAAIHGEADRLMTVHDRLAQRFRPGDRLVYTGNYLGHGRKIVETLDELLLFRRALLAMPGMLASDIVHLRGGQEEIWHKLLQVQFAPNPRDVLAWMLRQGVDATIAAYGGSGDQGSLAARGGPTTLTRWTVGLRGLMRAHPGHDVLLNALVRAAYVGSPDAVDGQEPQGVLVVHAGLDPTRTLEDQGDKFWWGAREFDRIDQPYRGFRRVVRGFDPGHGGRTTRDHTLTVDSGCGFGGKLSCLCLSPAGEILDTIEG